MTTNNPKLDDIQRLLNKPLHPALIERRETSRREPYISTTTAITQANRIIGALNWYLEIVDHHEVKNDVECIGYQCTVRIHIPSCNFQGEGIGFNSLTTKDGKILQTPESHDTAIKGAESDAVKRALRYLGDPFANFLYEDPAVRRAMAEAAIRVVAKRLNIEHVAAEAIVRRPYQSLEEVPLNTSMGHYYGRDAKPAQENNGEPAEQEDPQPDTRQPVQEPAQTAETDQEPAAQPAAHASAEPAQQPAQTAQPANAGAETQYNAGASQDVDAAASPGPNADPYDDEDPDPFSPVQPS